MFPPSWLPKQADWERRAIVAEVFLRPLTAKSYAASFSVGMSLPLSGSLHWICSGNVVLGFSAADRVARLSCPGMGRS